MSRRLHWVLWWICFVSAVSLALAAMYFSQGE
jgi:hypothetical protein